MGTKPTIRFSAELSPPEGTNNTWLLILPESASAMLPASAQTMVEGTINGFPFRAALEANSKGSRWLKVTREMRNAAGATAGEVATIEITRVGDEMEIREPTDLRKALATAARAEALWTEITPAARRDWVLWISSAKQEETRKGRIEKACDMLASGKKRVCCFGGLNWLTKDHPACETWLPLPSSKARSSAKSRK